MYAFRRIYGTLLHHLSVAETPNLVFTTEISCVGNKRNFDFVNGYHQIKIDKLYIYIYI